MKERIRELRKALGLSGEKFGESLGLTKMSISNIENGHYNITDQTIKLICSIYNVNENWLRTGEGAMFNNIDQTSLDDLIKTQSLDQLEIDLVKAYFSLPKEIREKAIQHFKNTLKE